MVPAAKPNNELGMLNQLLALNDSNPPPAVIFKAGYILACEIPTCAFAICNASSSERTSGLRLTIDTGKPAESSFATANSVNETLRETTPGSCPVKSCSAFSCMAIFCSNCGINNAVDCFCDSACCTP